MSRLWSSGFELNSVTASVEWTGTYDSAPTISTTTLRSGTYAMRVSSLSSGTGMGLYYNFASAASNGPYYFRTYIRVAARPSADNTVIHIDDQNDTFIVTVKLASDGSLKLFDEDGQIGSASSVLTNDTWYRVEIEIDRIGAGGTHVVRARLDGAEFAGASNRNLSVGLMRFALVGNGAFETQTTGDWFFDDIAINDTVDPGNGQQMSWPGEEKFISLRPNAPGDANEWDVTTYENIDEVTPDDATTVINDNVSGRVHEVNVDNTPAGLASGDIINVVHVGVRFRKNGATDTPTFLLSIKKSSGDTIENSATISATLTTWATNATAAPRNYALTLYDLPGASTSPWTKADLDTAQIGVDTTSNTTDTAEVSTLWLLVGYTPVAVPSYQDISVSNSMIV